jgi:hypothetical protein
LASKTLCQDTGGYLSFRLYSQSYAGNWVTAIYANALGAEEQGIATRMWDQKLPYI